MTDKTIEEKEVEAQGVILDAIISIGKRHDLDAIAVRALVDSYVGLKESKQPPSVPLGVRADSVGVHGEHSDVPVQMTFPTNSSVRRSGRGRKPRLSPFTFAELGIPVGSTLTLLGRPDVKCQVADDKRSVIYDRQEFKLSPLTQRLMNTSTSAGTLFWEYEGEIIDSRRRRLIDQRNRFHHGQDRR